MDVYGAGQFGVDDDFVGPLHQEFVGINCGCPSPRAISFVQIDSQCPGCCGRLPCVGCSLEWSRATQPSLHNYWPHWRMVWIEGAAISTLCVGKRRGWP